MQNRALGFSRWSILLVAVLLGLTPLGQAQERFNFSHSALTGSQAILFVTKDAGIFRKHNLDPQIIYITGAPPNIAALVAGSVDFVVFAGPAAITANLAGANTAVLMSFVNTMEHSIFSSRAIKSPTEMKGKTIGVSRPGSSDDYGARVALRKWGLEPDKEVSFVSVGGPPDRFVALQSGRVEAVLIQPPLTVRARKAGFNELAALADLGLDYLGTSLVTSRSVIDKKRDLVRRVVTAFAEGIHFYKTNKQASLRSIGKLMKIDDAEAIEESYNAYAIKFMARVPYPNPNGIEVILKDLEKTNPKARGADPRSFLETGFLKELEDGGYIAKLYGDKN
ncbi:MAG: ABC transporter substrate-binding protein [Deltaproteobacteria bacterium]|nr:ABC transporter substrate-binding protein [Deltaproteobacteria bacterium]